MNLAKFSLMNVRTLFSLRSLYNINTLRPFINNTNELFKKYMYFSYMLGNTIKDAILFITTHKRKRIKMKVHKSWKRWKKIKNVTKKNLKKE
jgi:hypothetical protein